MPSALGTKVLGRTVSRGTSRPGQLPPKSPLSRVTGRGNGPAPSEPEISKLGAAGPGPLTALDSGSAELFASKLEAAMRDEMLAFRGVGGGVG